MMSKAIVFLNLYEEASLDQLLSKDPEMPKRDFHFDPDLILKQARNFNIVAQKVDDFSTMKHCTDPWIYVVAKLNTDDYIENAKIAVKNGEIRVSNDKIDAGFDGNGNLTKIYSGKTKSDENAGLGDIYIKGCSKQLFTVLDLTFR